MHAGTRRQRRAITELSTTQVRYLQTALWVTVLALAVAVFLRTFEQQFRETVELTSMTPADAASFREHLARLGISNYTLTVSAQISTTLLNLVAVAIGFFLLMKRKGTDWFAFYVSLTFIAGTGAIYPPDLRGLVDGQPVWMAIGIGLTTLFITSLFLLPLLFPTGHFEPRWMALVGGIYLVGAFASIAFPGNDPMSAVGIPIEAISDLLLLAFVLGSMIYRYRRKATAVQRQQMKWGMTGAAIAMPAFFIADAAMRNIDGSVQGVVAAFVFIVLAPLFGLLFPICLTIAILRYRLWDIDFYVSRTLVWLLMTGLVVAAYVGIVLGVGSLLDRDHSTALGLIVLGLTAVLFQPVRTRVQHGINRIFFGERDDPYRVVRKLADDLAETIQPIEALHATVRTLTESLRLPYAAITLEPDALPVAVAGAPGFAEVEFPLVYQTQPVGELIVSPRGRSREFDGTDRKLLEELARQIGVVAHNVLLTNDLRASRERIVTAREEERRRLRRDLHDGLGAQLSALTLQTGAMKATISSDPDLAIAQATELQQELRAAVADIRRLVQGLRPAALDDLGLIGSIRNRIATINLGGEAGQTRVLVLLEAPDDLGQLPAAVEVAVYRIVDEGVNNVVQHAGATRCVITIVQVDSAIWLTIEDDGTGISPDRVSGVGLQSMRERAVELGGGFEIESVDPHGTRIIAQLPIATLINDVPA